MKFYYLFRKISFDVQLGETKETRTRDSKTFYRKEVDQFGIKWMLIVEVPLNDSDEIGIFLGLKSLARNQTQ